VLERRDNAPRRTLIQIVPQYGKGPNGVADYASTLARALHSYGLESVFLSGMPYSPTLERRDEWRTVSLPRRKSRSLANAIQSIVAETKAVAVLLHFSGYGYQKRGVPLWLLQGLQHWRNGGGCIPLFTVFHELFATGRPWQSSYWLSPFQELIVRSILRLSSDAIATTARYRDWLSPRTSGARVTCMPVFSNVGELGCARQSCDRAAIAITFGLAGVENRLFGVYRTQIEHVVSIMGIEKIIDIGPRLSATPTSLAGVPVIAKGALSPFEVSELLQHARYGFVAYPFDFLAKSGVFAAYAAHGIVPIVFSERGGSFDGLEVGQHLLDGFRISNGIDVKDLTLIQRQLSAWYASHSLGVQARSLTRSIKSLPPSEAHVPGWPD
jgi:hypothetical protein